MQQKRLVRELARGNNFSLFPLCLNPGWKVKSSDSTFYSNLSEEFLCSIKKKACSTSPRWDCHKTGNPSPSNFTLFISVTHFSGETCQCKIEQIELSDERRKWKISLLILYYLFVLRQVWLEIQPCELHANS